jgi:hypothetical protein
VWQAMGEAKVAIVGKRLEISISQGRGGWRRTILVRNKMFGGTNLTT